MARLTKEQKRLQSIEGTSMPQTPFSTKENWSKKLAQSVSGKMVKVGYMDTTEPVIGVAFFDDETYENGYPCRVRYVDISTGAVDEIDSPDQVYWVKSVPMPKE